MVILKGITGKTWFTHQSGSEPVNDSAKPYNKITKIGIINMNLAPLLIKRRSNLTRFLSYSCNLWIPFKSKFTSWLISLEKSSISGAEGGWMLSSIDRISKSSLIFDRIIPTQLELWFWNLILSKMRFQSHHNKIYLIFWL